LAKYKVKASELRRMSPEERKKLLEEWRRELITLRYKASTGALENPGKLRELRKNIARLLTIMREEELKGKG
jgi:large subunit ribosomal protein L29